MITQIDGGLRVKENHAGTHYIDVLVMLYNYRIVRTPKDRPATYDRYWCYAGNTQHDLLCAVAAAYAWDGADNTEPEGWNKNGQTKEWRDPANTPAGDA